MRHHVSDKYFWELNGVRIQGIIEYIGHDGIISSRWTHVRCREPRVGDFVDLREWNEAQGHEKYKFSYNDFGVIDSLNWLDEGDVHICTGGASVYLLDRNFVWSKTTLGGSPPPHDPSGTAGDPYGKFQYLPTLNAYYAVLTTSDNVRVGFID